MTPIYNLGDRPKRNLYEEAKARGLAFNKQVEENKKREALEAKFGKKPEAPKIQNPQKADLKGFVYVPSIQLYISKETFYPGKNWEECHRELAKENCFMPTLKHFVEFLRYLQTTTGYGKLADEILHEIPIPDKMKKTTSEWLDAEFDKRKGGWYLLSDHRIENGKLVANYEEPLKPCLMENSSIDLEFYLRMANSQGFPSEWTKNGKLLFCRPHNTCVVRFSVGPGSSIYLGGHENKFYKGPVRKAFKGEIK